MLSIGAMSAGQERYYLDLAQEDYYLNGGEPPGLWWGQGATDLNLKGLVKRHQLQQLFDGYSKDGQEKLAQNAGKPNRRPGWDLTFSAPKSVSVLWSQADREVRATIQSAHLSAVKAALNYVETEAAFSRRGKAGYERERVGLCVALFEHGTSRAGDPNLHTHGLVMNVASRSDGSTGTIESSWLYQHKMAAGAAYRAQLAYELQQRLGVEIERKRTWFEITDIPSRVCEYFSKRRTAILEKLGELGLETASAAAFATLSTRNMKELVAPRNELIRGWQQEAPAQGFGPENVSSLLGHSKPVERKNAYIEAVAEAVSVLTYSESHFSERELVRRTLEASQGRGLDTAFVCGWLKRDMQNVDCFVPLGERNGELRYSTKEILQQEERLFDLAKRLSSRPVCIAGPHCMDELRHLNHEQRDAVHHLTQRASGIALLSGIAGSGKTTTLRACRERWEAAGITVLGASLSGKAAQELQNGSGIKSDTLAMLEMRMQPSSSTFQMAHHLRQIGRAALHKKTYQLEPLKIDSKTVLVIDEAGMVGTPQMLRVLEAVQQQGGKVVLVGDAAQLQAIERGSPFSALAKRIGAAHLTENVRQKHERDRELIRDLVAGEAEKARDSLVAQGRICVEKTSHAAMGRLVADWASHRSWRPQDDLILCGTNAAAAEINRRCQKERVLRGNLDTVKSIKLGEEDRLFVGDRVLFTKIDRKLGVNNGDLGTVVGLDARRNRVSVRVDDRKCVDLQLDKYIHKKGERAGETALKLGYALTTHKTQGGTLENIYVFAEPAMQDREMNYVQLSRAKSLSRLYTHELEAGEGLTRLVREFEKSGKKTMAHDLLNQDHGLRLAM